MTHEELMARVRANVEAARQARAAVKGSRGLPGPDPDSGSLSEDEERDLADRAR